MEVFIYSRRRFTGYRLFRFYRFPSRLVAAPRASGFELVVDWLNECMEPMAKQVSAHGGVIEQYTGDAIVAVFGVPIARKDDEEISQDAINAVSCALAMETSPGPESPVALSESAHDCNADRYLYRPNGRR